MLETLSRMFSCLILYFQSDCECFYGPHEEKEDY